MKNYLIVFSNDVHNNVSLEAANLEDLKNELVNEELMNENEEISDFSWSVFENGILIQGQHLLLLVWPWGPPMLYLGNN